MAKILGLDLGTNSIGWAIRDTDENENQFFSTNSNADKELRAGVIVFKKGVGAGKSGEYSLAAERRTNRSKRRLYNARRYRKWALLRALIENDMCPLTESELKLWSVGNWQEIDGIKKNQGRIYPSSADFLEWLAMSEKYFGNNGTITNKTGDDSYIRKSPYDLRCDLLTKYDPEDKLRLYKIGRAFYHLAQRRGFKSNRKNGKSTFGENEYLESRLKDDSELRAAQILNEGLKKENRRIRNSGVIQRRYFEDEFNAICTKQKLSGELVQRIYDTIYFVRPLKTQKGLVGKCTLETRKTRIPLSHPLFEEFRALQFINNIKWRETFSQKDFVDIDDINVKKQILKELYFKRKRGGEIDERNYFEFKEIVDKFSDNHRYEFNYARYKDNEGGQFELASNPNVSACPVIAGLMNVFDDEWEDKFIEDEKHFGINWDKLRLSYEAKYKEIIKRKEFGYTDIWHLLFDYLQIKDDEDGLKDFCLNVLDWDVAKTDKFLGISLSQGYGSLSFSAINKIVPFLREGRIYPEAVLFANLHSVLGKHKFEKSSETIKYEITKTIVKVNKDKELLNITNSLIQKFFSQNPATRAKGLDGTVEESAYYKKEVTNKLINYFGEKSWNYKTADEKAVYENFILEKYLRFMDGKQGQEEKASAAQHKAPITDYYKLPRLDQAIKTLLKTKYDVNDTGLKKLYHPSDIEIYPKSKSGELEDPNPPSKGWKNPMAMRTMHELRKLINYLLQTGQIDTETRIVVEMARENNDANYRKAYTDWITDRTKENQVFAKEISENLTNTILDDISDDDYNKFRTAVQQISEQEFTEDKGKIFLQKYREFIDEFLLNKSKKEEKEEKQEVETDENRDLVDYLMYLILCRDEFSKYLNFKLPNSTKWHRQILKTSTNFNKKRHELQDMLVKYRLWKQQKFICLYTGDIIPFTKLFSENYQLEHTIPRSISFDSELKNLTVCDAVYNTDVKKNQFPTQCPNYYESSKVRTTNGVKECGPIEQRVNRYLRPKADELRLRINNLQKIARKIPDWEKAKKDANIQLRHYLRFELEYWDKKLKTFTVKKDQWKDEWKNSQLTDTQSITKYARAYLKTVFNRVDVQKGTVTADFRKIYGIAGAEKKDRSKHSHHAVDAAVLTLIPGSAKREETLDRAYKHFEKTKRQYHEIPYGYYDFGISHIQAIETQIVVNHITKDQTLSVTQKKVRKRGRIVYNIDKNGNRIPRIAQGDCIRGQLHKENFFGAIKVSERNSEGFAIRKNGGFQLKQKNDQDEIWIVVRKPIEKVDIEKDQIIDEVLKRHLIKQIKNGKKITETTDFQNKPIRHLRCRVKVGVGFLSKEKALPIKRHVFLSKHKHKQEVLAQNDENYLYLLYEGKNKNNKTIRGYRILNLFHITQLGIKTINELKIEKEYQTLADNKKGLLSLKAILKVGHKIILYKENKEEISKENLPNRLYKIYKFNEVTPTGYLYCQFHSEASPDSDLGDGDTLFNPEKYQPRLKLSADNFKGLIENIDFEVRPDGEIKWL